MFIAMRSRSFIALAVLLAACSGSAEVTTTTRPSTTTSTTTSTTQATPTTTITTLPVELNPQQVFAAVSPAVAFVATDLGTGSGVRYGSDFLVTNAHVVWPYETARVVFPDGTEILDAPVMGWDYMGDLAVIDLSGTPGLPEPPAFVDGSGLPIGTEVFLIGYPAEGDEFPQPTFTSGILSQHRTWDTGGMDFIQSDAVITGGQSGGALVSNRGEVLGISGLTFGEGFALVTGAADVVERIDGLLAGDDVDGLGNRQLPKASDADQTSYDFAVDNFLDEDTFLVYAEQDTDVDITAQGKDDIRLVFLAPDGVLEADADEVFDGPETITSTLLLPGPHLVSVLTFTLGLNTGQIDSNVPLTPFPDPDHGKKLAVDSVTAAHADYPGDIDYFFIDLVDGQTIEITVTSLILDVDLLVDRLDNPDEPLAYDDDSGGGIYQTDATIEFTADQTGEFLIGVTDLVNIGPAGYYIEVVGR